MHAASLSSAIKLHRPIDFGWHGTGGSVIFGRGRRGSNKIAEIRAKFRRITARGGCVHWPGADVRLELRTASKE